MGDLVNAHASGIVAAPKPGVRFYDPATGQFLTRDPLVSATREAYGYVGGSPLNRTDPSGQDWSCVTNPGSCDLPIPDSWEETLGKAKDDNPEWNVCVGANVVAGYGYCHNFVGVRPNGGGRVNRAGFGASADISISGGTYSKRSVSVCGYAVGGVCVGDDLDKPGRFNSFSAGLGIGANGPLFQCTEGQPAKGTLGLGPILDWLWDNRNLEDYPG